VLTSPTVKEAPVSAADDAKQFVGIDLHRRRSVITGWAAAAGPDYGDA
jgi:hypothetical protein